MLDLLIVFNSTEPTLNHLIVNSYNALFNKIGKGRRISLYLLCLCLLPFLTSCFEVIEEVNVNQDGSGTLTYTFNLSQSRTKINSVLLLDSINGYKVPSKDEIKKEFNVIVAKVKEIEGVSNVKNTINLDEFIFSITADFSNVDVLNKAIIEYSSKKDAEKMKNEKHFTYDKDNGMFTRSYHYKLDKEYQNMSPKDKDILEKAYYTTIYRFDQSIVYAQNSAAKIAGNKKAIMLKVNMMDMIMDRETIKNQIKLE